MDRVVSLVVITLLQLCRANIPNALPQWYAANLINDPNYSPKPLTEIFSTVGVFPTNTDASTFWTSTTTASTTAATTTEPATTNVQTQGTQIDISRQPPPAMSQITNPPQNRGSPAIIWPVLQSTQAPQTVPTDPPVQSTSPIWNGNQPNWPNQPGQGVWNGNNLPQNQQNIQPYLPLAISLSTNSPTSNRPCDTTSSQASIDPQAQEPSAATPSSESPRPVLTISVRRRGHKTNVLINPSTTTTTTRKPTTTRRKRNNYEVCLESCKNKKEPICSSPKGAAPTNINPDNLKGFASMCHMTCQNNFRNQQYEKVADGRCGKLRTRIRPVGQDKLNRNELNKAQYSVVHNGDETVIEFSALDRST